MPERPGYDPEETVPRDRRDSSLDIWGGPDEGQEEQPGEVLANQEPEHGGLLYEPFDPKAELTKVAHYTDEEKAMLAEADRSTKPERALLQEEVRQSRRARLEEYKEQLSAQKEGLRFTLAELYEDVHKEADPNLEGLVETDAKQYRYSSEQLEYFNKGLEAYHARHEAVVAVFNEHGGDPSKLFEACFGSKPMGQVVVMANPMTLHFQCFEKDDYAAAYSYYATRGDRSRMTEDVISQATSSGGASLHLVALPELEGAVTIENASINKRADVKEIDVRRDLKNDNVHIDFATLRELVVSTDGARWKVSDISRDESGRVLGLTVGHARHDKFLGVVKLRAVYDSSNGIFRGWNRSDLPNAAPKASFNHDILGASGTPAAGIRVMADGLEVFDMSDRGAQLAGRVLTKSEKAVIANQDVSRNVQVHEEQHQFNALFKPLERETDAYMLGKLEKRVIEKELFGVEAVRYIAEELARVWRSSHFDAPARDEILAYYRDGTLPEQIAETLINNRLYDYYEFYAKDSLVQHKMIMNEGMVSNTR